MIAQIAQRFENLLQNAAVDGPLPWQPYTKNGRTNVDIVELFDATASDSSGAKAAILRYRAGAVVPRHVHTGYEFVLVLDGELVNDTGTHRSGTLEVYPPGSSHRLESPGGCTFLVVWAKPVAVSDPIALAEPALRD